MFGNWSHGSVATISLCYRCKGRRLALRSAALQKCGASLRKIKWGGGRGALYSSHWHLSGPRLYPDTINPAFHLCLALKMSLHYPHSARSGLSLVRHLWMSCVNWDTRQEWQHFFFFSLRPLRGLVFCFGHSAPIHRCQKVSGLFLCCPHPIPEGQTAITAATEENTQPEEGRYR